MANLLVALAVLIFSVCTLFLIIMDMISYRRYRLCLEDAGRVLGVSIPPGSSLDEAESIVFEAMNNR